MDMMETDIACEPLQHFGKFIEGTAIHARVKETPFLVTFPVGWVEVMLYVEQPDARTTGHQQNGDLDQKICLPADVIHRPANESEQGNVRPHHAVSFALARACRPEAVCKGENDGC